MAWPGSRSGPTTTRMVRWTASSGRTDGGGSAGEQLLVERERAACDLRPRVLAARQLAGAPRQRRERVRVVEQLAQRAPEGEGIARRHGARGAVRGDLAEAADV